MSLGATGYSVLDSAVARLHDPCEPADGRAERRADGSRKNGATRTPRLRSGVTAEKPMFPSSAVAVTLPNSLGGATSAKPVPSANGADGRLRLGTARCIAT